VGQCMMDCIKLEFDDNIIISYCIRKTILSGDDDGLSVWIFYIVIIYPVSRINIIIMLLLFIRFYSDEQSIRN